jgi:Ras-related protein Rab-8A
VGNKCDLPQTERIVSTEEGILLAEKYKVPFLETSAKEGTNINEMFQVLGEKMVEKFKNTVGDDHSKDRGAGSGNAVISGGGDPPKKKKDCCQ